MHIKKPSRPCQPRGQSLVEFALLLPILLLLVLGAMDFGRMFSTKITLTNAAREGANYLARHPDEYPNTTNTAAVIATEASSLTGYTLAIACSGGCNTGDTATVTLTQGVDLITGGFLQTFGVGSGPLQLSSTVEMMVQ